MTSQLRAYFIGNSVTDTINQAGLDALAESSGGNLSWGRHMIPGAPLSWIWDNSGEGFREQPYGYYPNALGSFEWDVLSLQPFDRPIVSDDGQGDLQMASNYINLALPNSPDLQVYIYQRWPRKPADNPNPTAEDWDRLWQRPYTDDASANANESRAYFDRLQAQLQQAFPTLKPIQIVPVGDVLFELNQKMQQGQVPGYSSIWDLYADGIHLTNVGSYIVAATYYTTLFGGDVTQLPIPTQYTLNRPEQQTPNPISSELEAIIEQTVQSVVGRTASGGSPLPPSPLTPNNPPAPDASPLPPSPLTPNNPPPSGGSPLSSSSPTSNNPPASGRSPASNNISSLSIAIADVLVTEGRDATATIALNLSRPANQPITVNYSTVNGTAQAGSDYQAISGTLTFAPGQTTQTIALPILNDSVTEPDEILTIALSNASNGAIFDASAIVTITDTLQTASSATLPDALENLLLLGTDPINGIGNANSNSMMGNAGNNRLQGKAGSDALKGGAGNDRLLGQSGADTLIGEAGNDRLTGGNQTDRFVFGAGLPFAQLGLDRITDFVSGIDRIVLDKAAFTQVQSRSGRGFQVRSEFAIVDSDRAAATQSALIVYGRRSGSLFYNENGRAAGLDDGGRFAVLEGSPELRARDFVIQ